MTLVFDTSFLIDAIRGNKDALSKLDELERDDDLLCTTSLNVLELFRGAYLSSKRDEKIAKIRNILEQLLILPIIEETYHIYGAISSSLTASGVQIGDFDEIIAAITISHNGVIITRDYHFDRLPMLDILHY
ncbi:MAG: type II toxin-antitoxin system VapC family toxin [Methanotrichaceae archaeon]